tara:strand:+ start:6431 stop:6928 length:498 start_codon:yes stop_codon:yes gene_type:complete
MVIDATFWVAVSFVIFIGGLFYLKVPQKINNALEESIKKIKKDLENAESLKDEAKNILSDYETKFSKAKQEINDLVKKTKSQSEIDMIRTNEEFHKISEINKKLAEEKIRQMKNQAIKDVKNISVSISIIAVEKLIKNSIDKKKLDKINLSSIEEAKNILKTKNI